jgi:DNA modification methylase
VPIVTRQVKGMKYVYFREWNAQLKKHHDTYIGPADDSKTPEKIKELERGYLERQISTLKNQLNEFEQPVERPKKKRSSGSRSFQGNVETLMRLEDVKIFEPEIHYKSSENMAEVKDGSVQLIVTSPPYNVGKGYTLYNDKRELAAYLAFVNRVWIECKRVLCKGGRIAVNISDTWRQPYIPLHALIVQQFLELGFLMRGVIYWDKGASVGVSTAWGSWRSASNPTLRDVGEYILIFCKDSFKLESENRISTVTSPQFTTYTKSLWSFPTADPKKEGHPAPFPDELPKRLIQLYTYLGDTVLDPFLGSGTTCKVAKAWGRRSIGYEIDESYRPVIEAKIAKAENLAIPLDSYSTNGKQHLDAFVPIQSPRNSDTKRSN